MSRLCKQTLLLYFYPRPPRGGRPSLSSSFATSFAISIHALREEGDNHQSVSETDERRFLSTPSARRATTAVNRTGHETNISIHALREEGDFIDLYYFFVPNNFYPRPPRGGRPCVTIAPINRDLFLSTPSARRATYAGRREGGQWTISIHALREEGDYTPRLNIIDICDFYPRPPRGGRLPLYPFFGSQNNFYPRPPRGGRRAGHGTERAQKDFYPRPPRGGRHPGILPQSA